MAEGDKVEMDAICRMETHTKTYCVKIERYSLTKALKVRNCIPIGMFDLAGLFWGFQFFPNGNWGDKDCISFILVLLTETSITLGIEYEISLLDSKGMDSTVSKKCGNSNFSRRGQTDGFHNFMKRIDLESSEFLNDDCLTVKLHLTVIKPFFINATIKQIIVPSPDLHQHFGGLLESGEGADVTFEIEGEAFRAHRSVLAARSPGFKAQLFGSMMESKMDKITVEGMRADVFKIMLRFIYTDMLPSELKVSFEMAQHLLVAADRYGLERLKVICGKMLCDSLAVKTAASTLVLADQHNCTQLKDVCIDFLASRDVLDAVMETDGFKHLMSYSSSLLKEILDKVHSSRKI
ncbi:BTB/POZ and MATH domain-containing protein 2 [Rhynchospora pubera]|uniref:BTB/POZ and MATH domain-containing protein 2 n=1 Tax=Rhynchospora pubera TaxID=906938 RepID=A0AAV8GN17_9POAL|nr:BTB/POZ and MATH domain-containing protein 2 [Rhynchospora pubera]